VFIKWRKRGCGAVVGRDDYPTPLLSEIRRGASEALWKGRTGCERRFAPGLLSCLSLGFV